MTCQDAQALLRTLSCGEATAADRAALAAHAAGCPACRQRWQGEEAWLALVAQRRPAPVSDAALAQARQALHRALAAEPAASARRGWRWPAFSARAFSPPWTPRWSPAWAALLLIAGFGGGWWAHHAPSLIAGSPASAAQVRVQTVEPASAPGQVRIVYDLVRQQQISGPATNPRLRHLLLLAASQPANAGMQLESIAALRPAASQNPVRQTLLAALTGDPNPGVRLEALNALRPLVTANAGVRAALAQVVLRDPNPGLRMQAVAALAQAPRADAGRWLRRLSVQSSDPYVRLNCVAAMQQLDLAPPAAAWGAFAAQPAPASGIQRQ